jgi:hypothetical protein
MTASPALRDIAERTMRLRHLVDTQISTWIHLRALTRQPDTIAGVAAQGDDDDLLSTRAGTTQIEQAP